VRIVGVTDDGPGPSRRAGCSQDRSKVSITTASTRAKSVRLTKRLSPANVPSCCGVDEKAHQSENQE